MKRTTLSFLIIVLLTFGASHALAGERVYRALSGEAGYAVGGSMDSVLMGSTTKGAAGIAAGNIERRGIPVPLPQLFIQTPGVHLRYGYPQGYQKGYHSYDRRCRIVRNLTYRHGERYIIEKRICKDDRGYRRGHYFDKHDRYWDRHYDRRDRYGDRHYDRRDRYGDRHDDRRDKYRDRRFNK